MSYVLEENEVCTRPSSTSLSAADFKLQGKSNNELLTQTIPNTAVDRTTAKTAKSVVDNESNASTLRGNSQGVSKLMAACAELRFPAQIGSVDGLMTVEKWIQR